MVLFNLLNLSEIDLLAQALMVLFVFGMGKQSIQVKLMTSLIFISNPKNKSILKHPLEDLHISFGLISENSFGLYKTLWEELGNINNNQIEGLKF